MDPSRLRQRIVAAQKLRAVLEQTMLNARPPLLAASLVFYRNVCGKKNCACKAGHTHGPYAYLSAKVKGKTKLKMVPKSRLERDQAAVGRYREYQQAFKRARGFNRELEGQWKSLRKELVRQIV